MLNVWSGNARICKKRGLDGLVAWGEISGFGFVFAALTFGAARRLPASYSALGSEVRVLCTEYWGRGDSCSRRVRSL